MTPNIDKIIEHYNHAREKHPYFVDKLFRYDKDDLTWIEATIENRRWQIKTLPNDGDGELNIYPIMSCEWYELLEAYLNGNTHAAIEEAYDCIAVLLRTIDVLEGRQKLGKPEEEGENNEQ